MFALGRPKNILCPRAKNIYIYKICFFKKFSKFFSGKKVSKFSDFQESFHRLKLPSKFQNFEISKKVSRSKQFQGRSTEKVEDMKMVEVQKRSNQCVPNNFYTKKVSVEVCKVLIFTCLLFFFNPTHFSKENQICQKNGKITC